MVSSTEDLLQYAKINEQGSILLGKNTVVDGYQHGREIGVFSHIHKDHIELFTYAMHECSAIFVSPPTFDMLAAIEQDEKGNLSSETYFSGRHIHRLDFDTPIIPKKYLRVINPKIEFSDKITLKKAHHILGSSQVLINTDDGKDIVYSSDFSYPETEAIECDVLVLDSTHGDPMFNAVVDSQSLENRLVEHVDQEIEAGNPVCIRTHVGRLQYVMSLLSQKLADNIPFLSTGKNKKLVPIYTKYGMPIRNIIDSKTFDGEEILEGGFPFIEFKTIPESKSIAEMDKRSVVFHLGGQFLGSKTTIKQNLGDHKNYYLEFGDHGNYSNIIKYVEKCAPKLVITDNYRSAWGKKLAENIHKELNIDTASQP
jgi:putative mRNA 3-end processing factor